VATNQTNTAPAETKEPPRRQPERLVTTNHKDHTMETVAPKIKVTKVEVAAAELTGEAAQ
jgi:hypothetical protein